MFSAKITITGVEDKPGIAANTFEPLNKAQINVDMVIQNISSDQKTTDITFTVKREDVSKTLKILKENAKINQLEDHPIRWIVDDVNKFLTREIRRGRRYHGILLDPPSFGRGKSGELYKIEHAMVETLEKVHRVLSPEYRFIYLTSHTPGFTPTVLSNLLKKIEKNGNISSGEMLLKGKDPNTLSIPNGAWACIDR